MHELGKAIRVLTDPVQFILHHELHMKKVFAQWVPRLFTLKQKRNRIRTSAECLKLFKINSTDCLRRFVDAKN